jgi:hypothetical protein
LWWLLLRLLNVAGIWRLGVRVGLLVVGGEK